MFFPIPIFIRPKTKEEIEQEARFKGHQHFLYKSRILRGEINKFKENFRHGDITDNPYLRILHVRFPNKQIDELGLHELLQLGFMSDNICREHLERRDRQCLE